MKHLRHLRKFTLTALALASLCTTAAASGSLVIAPGVSSVTAGDSFAVQVRGSSFTDNVVGGGFSLSFDAALLSLSSVVVDAAEWDFNRSPGTIDNVGGMLSNVWFNAFADPLPTGNFQVATLNFVAKAAGTSTLALMGSPDFPFANDLVEVVSVSYGTGRVDIAAAVPEPATWASLALGLALLPMVRRRMRSA